MALFNQPTLLSIIQARLQHDLRLLSTTSQMSASYTTIQSILYNTSCTWTGVQHCKTQMSKSI